MSNTNLNNQKTRNVQNRENQLKLSSINSHKDIPYKISFKSSSNMMSLDTSDLDKLRDELKQTKQEIFKRALDYKKLKVTLNKLKESSKSDKKLMESLYKEANKRLLDDGIDALNSLFNNDNKENNKETSVKDSQDNQDKDLYLKDNYNLGQSSKTEKDNSRTEKEMSNIEPNSAHSQSKRSVKKLKINDENFENLLIKSASSENINKIIYLQQNNEIDKLKKEIEQNNYELTSLKNEMRLQNRHNLVSYYINTCKENSDLNVALSKQLKISHNYSKLQNDLKQVRREIDDIKCENKEMESNLYRNKFIPSGSSRTPMNFSSKKQDTEKNNNMKILINSYKKQNKEKDETINKLKAELDELNNNAKDKAKQNEQKEEKIKKDEKKIKDIEKELNDKDEQLKKMEEEYYGMLEENKKLKKKNAQISAIYQNEQIKYDIIVLTEQNNYMKKLLGIPVEDDKVFLTGTKVKKHKKKKAKKGKKEIKEIKENNNEVIKEEAKEENLEEANDKENKNEKENEEQKEINKDSDVIKHPLVEELVMWSYNENTDEKKEEANKELNEGENKNETDNMKEIDNEIDVNKEDVVDVKEESNKDAVINNEDDKINENQAEEVKENEHDAPQVDNEVKGNISEIDKDKDKNEENENERTPDIDKENQVIDNENKLEQDQENENKEDSNKENEAYKEEFDNNNDNDNDNGNDKENKEEPNEEKDSTSKKEIIEEDAKSNEIKILNDKIQDKDN